MLGGFVKYRAALMSQMGRGFCQACRALQWRLADAGPKTKSSAADPR
jgi:hypothetical protein